MKRFLRERYFFPRGKKYLSRTLPKESLPRMEHMVFLMLCAGEAGEDNGDGMCRADCDELCGIPAEHESRIAGVEGRNSPHGGSGEKAPDVLLNTGTAEAPRRCG